MPRNSQPKRSHKNAANKSHGADKALAEALSIVREAEARSPKPDDREVDWTQDPRNEREAALRSAVMRRVVAGKRTIHEDGQKARYWLMERTPTECELARDAAIVARHVALALESLVTDQVELDEDCDDAVDYTYGCDLLDMIEHWEGIAKENEQRARRLERQRLIEEAKVDI